ncbi:unnamed protein product [Kuraishia capsulata CBS 1993]|uniref:Cytochrome c oxidase-assembly factor COX23, mitochondrial n=1 Tax=Kuraishia capsulata CBS 1993 TaxID=1382522 RepID=W6MXY2_9ASCO|nr:uncharacterized protein KUCA_T00005673001 [Kuraishia capsulata CBS 1993]CDK29680.1 unnamed protein product [Kuraishia capsulata CBS 1993]
MSGKDAAPKSSVAAEAKVDFAPQTSKVEDFQYYPDKPLDKLHSKSFFVKEPSRYYDPCAESSKMAVRCMESHEDDYREVCAEYFKAYRECKKEWMLKRREGTW